MTTDSYVLPKGNVKVYVRPLPRADEDYGCIKVLDDKKSVLAKCLQDFSLHHPRSEFYWKYEVDEVFYNSTQLEVFNVVSEDCIKEAIEGNNTIFIGYGQTNSGKSFTLNGLYHNYQQRGIGPRVMTLMLETKSKLEEDFKIEFGMSYCEIRGNEFYDLLSSGKTGKYSKIRYSKFENINILVVSNEEQALGLLFEGEGRRLINNKSKYTHSHLCSSILTFYVISTSLKRSCPVQKLAKIQIVDLAGVDKIGNTSCLGKSSLDIGTANKDLTFLKMFLSCLNTSKHGSIDTKVMQRYSLLVNFLSDTLNGKSFLRFICNIKTNKQFHSITLSMLRITQIIKGIKPTLLNPLSRFQPEAQIMMLEELLNQCKKEAMRTATFSEEEIEKYICRSRWEHLKHLADDFLNGTISEMNILSSSHVKTVLQVMRDKYFDLSNESIALTKKEYERGLADARLSIQLHSPSSTIPLGKPLQRKRVSSKASLRSATVRSSIPDSIPSIHNSVGDLNRAFGKGVGPGMHGPFGDTPLIKAAKQSNVAHLGSKQRITDSPQFDIPNREDIWNQFIKTEIFEALSEKITLEQQRKESLKAEYNNEVQKLNKAHSDLDKAKQVLRQAQMRRYLYKHEEYSPDGLVIPTDEEKLCLSSMYEAKTALRQQIDVVAVFQSDLKNSDEEILKIQTDMENLFQTYCHENYNIILPELTVPETSFSGHQFDLGVVEPLTEILGEGSPSPVDDEMERKFRNQQRLMQKVARNKLLHDFYNNRKWVTDFKH